MTKVLMAAVFMTALMCGASAQSTSPAPTIAPGSVIPVELTRTIDAKKAKPGDEVVAKVTQDMKTSSGEMIVAKDTKIEGHVAEVRARSKEQKESEVGVVFDKAITRNGEMKLPMSIQAIIAPPNNTAEDSGGGAPNGPVTGGGTATSPMAGRTPISPPTQPQPQSLPTSANGQAGSGARPPINANTQGVIGIPNLKLAANAQDPAQGSVVTSEKGNVKLESGTLLLLRVNP